MTLRTPALSAAFALVAAPFLAVPLSGAALAADMQAQPAAAQVAQAPQGQAPQVNEELLTAYALAALDVSRIQGQLAAQTEQAQNTEQVEQLREQATVAMIEAIEEQGMDVQQFNQVNAAVAQDPGLQETVQQIQRQAQ